MLAIKEFEVEHDETLESAKYILRKGDDLPNQHFDEDEHDKI
jgi:hypothetical protein